jgi:hypothetical protein
MASGKFILGMTNDQRPNDQRMTKAKDPMTKESTNPKEEQATP